MDYVNPKELVQDVVVAAGKNAALSVGDMMFGAPVSIRTWLFWNQLPVTLGNIVSGALFTGVALYATFRQKQPGPSEDAAMDPVSRPDAIVNFAHASGAAQ